MEKNELDFIKKQCMDKWGEKDEKIEQFEMNFDQWSMFSTNEDKTICLNLLENFDYYSKSRVNLELKKLHKQLLEIWNFDSEHTVYTIIKNKDGKINSSLEYLLEYRFVNDIEWNLCREDITCIKDKMYQNIDNVVIIDDCIGSGQTTRDFFERYRSRLVGKKIYLILVHAVSEFANKLSDFAESNDYTLTILCANLKEKAFARNKDDEKKEKFITLSKNKKIPEDRILGRDDVEALVSFYNNTPNNTLGIFWCETEKNVPLFRRNKNKPVWTTDKRKQQNYRNAGVNL